MNVNYGLFPSLSRRLRGREKKRALADRALKDLAVWQAEQGLSDLADPSLPSTPRGASCPPCFPCTAA